MIVRENSFPARVLLRVGCSIIFITKWRVGCIVFIINLRVGYSIIFITC